MSSSPTDEKVPSKGANNRRPSLNVDTVIIEGSRKLDQGERRLSVASLKLRSDLELWLMKEIPRIMGIAVDDSDDLPESLQEENQSLYCEQVLFDKENLSDDDVKAKIDEFFAKAKETAAAEWDGFVAALLQKTNTARSTILDARKHSKSVPLSSVQESGKEE